MKKYKFHQIILSGLVSSLLFLSGCSFLPEKEDIGFTIQERPNRSTLPAPTVSYQPPPVTPVEAANTRPAPRPQITPQPKPSITQANQLMQRGQRAEAAAMYYRSAYHYPSPQRERIILQAAEISASLNNAQQTTNYLQKVARHKLTPVNQVRYRYIQSLLALHNNQPNQALGLLPRNAPRLPVGLSDKIALVRKRATNMGGRAPDSPANAPAPNNTNRQISSSAPPVQYQPTQQAMPHAPPPKNVPDTTQLNQQQANPQPVQNQPAQPRYALPQASNKIAVLLPGKGALGNVGDEVYQGVKDAQATYGRKVLSRRYNVDKNNVVNQYQRAVADGADIILGPLDKDSLATLTAQPQLLSIPVLSLNYLPSAANTPNTLYQFGLSPDDEARQIAEFSLSRGQRNGAIMAPDSTWGKRLASTFAQTYQQRGGKVLDITFYANKSPSTYLKRVRKLLTQAQGADMVFLAASPTQARLLRPLLKDQAGIIPVYATSHIFSGRSASNKDIDLDGIIYTEIPYILRKTGRDSLDQLKYPRLYALGMDSLMVAKNLAPLIQRQSLAGQTGQIRMDPQRRVQRQLEFATFINGQPHNLGQ